MMFAGHPPSPGSAVGLEDVPNSRIRPQVMLCRIPSSVANSISRYRTMEDPFSKKIINMPQARLTGLSGKHLHSKP